MDNGCRKSVINVVWRGQREAAPLTELGLHTNMHTNIIKVA